MDYGGNGSYVEWNNIKVATAGSHHPTGCSKINATFLAAIGRPCAPSAPVSTPRFTSTASPERPEWHPSVPHRSLQNMMMAKVDDESKRCEPRFLSTAEKDGRCSAEGLSTAFTEQLVGGRHSEPDFEGDGN
jgi:hypothetical protein